ncbi:MAG: RT0821/Lpp0805 family surface protein [Alphaproteobacteria bacterium]|nr:RT0821/Lpp0805 family surface protein [Alphaproteobacteria bacterium]
MRNIFTTGVAALALAAMLGGGTVPAHADDGCSRTSTGGLIGGVAGAAAGIGIGSLIGSGTGRSVAMALGGLGGLIVGNEIGRKLDCDSQQKAVQTQNQALESQPTGTSSGWRNPDDNASGSTTPTRTWTNAQGQPCRDYVTTITHQGQTSEVQGSACRQQQSDGSYQWVSTDS